MKKRSKLITFWAAMAAILALLLTFPLFAGDYYPHILILVFLNVVLAVGYRLLYVTGLGSFCHIIFFALGGYTSALLGLKFGLPYWACFIAAGIVSAVIAVLFGWPSVRVKGAYFFLITFAFFVVMETVFRQWDGLTGGARGLINIPGIVRIGQLRPYYYLAMGLMVFTILIMYRLDKSRFGEELLAIGDDEDLAGSVGINVTLNRVVAFSIGALFAGFAGSVYASYISFISPASFTLLFTVYVLIWVAIGGPRKLWGPIAGAVILTFIAEALRMSGIAQAILMGVVLLVAIMLLPGGLAGFVEDLKEKRRIGGEPVIRTEFEEDTSGM